MVQLGKIRQVPPGPIAYDLAGCCTKSWPGQIYESRLSAAVLGLQRRMTELQRRQWIAGTVAFGRVVGKGFSLLEAIQL